MDYFNQFSSYLYIVSEITIDFFTPFMGLPILLAIAKEYGRTNEIQDAIYQFGETHRNNILQLQQIYEWSVQLMPSFFCEKERSDYISNMATKGGIAEAVLNAFRSGCSVSLSLTKGILRCKEINDELNEKLIELHLVI